MNRVLSRATDESGAVLLLALGFITFVGVIGIALITYATANMHASAQIRQLRSAQYAADAAVDSAITRVRYDQTQKTKSGCFTDTSNGVQMRVDCSFDGTSGEVIFDAFRVSGGPAVLEARAKLDWTSTPATVSVTEWSVRK